MIVRQAVAGVAAGVVALATAAPIAAQAPVSVPRPVLERYLGEYVYPDGNTVKIVLDGDTLLREVPGQRVVLVPISHTMFRMGSVFTTEFVTDQAGEMTQVLTDGVEIEFRLRRKGSRAVAPQARTAASSDVRVPRSVLERYVGTYEYLPGQMSRTDLRVVVRLKGDTLIREMGPGQTVLTPISETQFKVGNTRLTVEFVVDEAGVTQVMGSGFQQMLARLKPKGR